MEQALRQRTTPVTPNRSRRSPVYGAVREVAYALEPGDEIDVRFVMNITGYSEAEHGPHIVCRVSSALSYLATHELVLERVGKDHSGDRRGRPVTRYRRTALGYTS